MADGPGVILVVDDTATVLRVVQAMLERYGYEPICVRSGRDAVAVLESPNPPEIDLVLLDVVLEDMTGHETAAEIRRLRPGLPIVFMTGFPEHREVLRAKDEVVIRKPFTSLKLVRILRRILDEPRTAKSAAPAG